MKHYWTEAAWNDYLHWQKVDRSILRKINALIDDIERDPFRGIGKLEPLKGPLTGWWPRRITDEHRLVYRIKGRAAAQVLEIAQCRFHY